MRLAYNAGDAKVVSLHLGHLHGRAADVPHSDTGKMTTLERRENVTVISTNTVSYLDHSNTHCPSRLCAVSADATPSKHGGSTPNQYSQLKLQLMSHAVCHMLSLSCMLNKPHLYRGPCSYVRCDYTSLLQYPSFVVGRET